MKTFSLFFFFLVNSAMAECDNTKCYDPCSGSNIEINGDKCSVTWNSEKQCFEAYAECKDSKKCLGALCFDYCQERYIYFPKTNTCSTFFDPAHMCSAASANCE